MQRVDLNDVVLFVDVVHRGSFSAAASARGVPVSTVSRRIARLEDTLKSRLLERTTRRLRVTEAGRAYLAHAERAVDELGQGRDKLTALDASPRGRVRIAATPGMAPMLMTMLAPFAQAHPAVVLELDLTDRRVDLLLEGFDIALRSGPVDTPDFAGRRIFNAVRGLYAAKEYLARRGRPRKLADLAAHDLIATRATESGAVWDLIVGKRPRRYVFRPKLVVNELMAARHAARAGIGIVLIPPPEVERSDLERVLPSVSGPYVGMWLLYPAHRTTTAAVRACADHMLARFPARPE
ncbi:MAG: LysR family transcriptional regulator [Myxococcales bacterium]|nr:LysR family transcriptional regulator [Myxococcales bacterium]